MREQAGYMLRQRVGLLVALGVALVLGATSVGIWATRHGAASRTENANLAPAGSVMKVAAVGDIHDEGPSSIATATAAEAGNADFILGLGDYQYDEGAMWKYNAYFEKTWGPKVPKVCSGLAPKHEQL